MRLVSVKNLKPDMVLAKSIYQGNRILLQADCQQLHKYKNRLLDLGITEVYINDKKSEGIEIKHTIDREIREETKKVIKEVIEDITSQKRVNIKKVKKSIVTIVNSILEDNTTLIHLTDIKTTDNYTFNHSLNVAILSVSLGQKLHYPKKRLTKLGIGAVLHDIGKIEIPIEVLNKPDQLTQEEFKLIKEHPTLGYQKLKDHYEISPLSRAAILNHHEKVNGTGYPEGLKGKDIHEFGRIVAITDVFDALTSNRCYRQRWPVHKAVNFLHEHSNTHFDQNLVNKFIDNIALYPNGTLVTLNTGQEAIVKEQNKQSPMKPIVRIISDQNKQELKTYRTIDLQDKNDLYIINNQSAIKTG
ncbi:HD-GYP domain-containing protein [Natroniella sulfidigena]|uniref:HD-GYP domain-containing protein n=1 Tax=Natroniella sulfidigena TaxID=723921 RepID=UPI00200A1374|nr:HD-GYP domain-containing protein [Natroniella sulfidigena]MCK8818019.1 HD-GYP domain-containing protein [Natroniella sulfidigena]